MKDIIYLCTANRRSTSCGNIASAIMEKYPHIQVKRVRGRKEYLKLSKYLRDNPPSDHKVLVVNRGVETIGTSFASDWPKESPNFTIINGFATDAFDRTLFYETLQNVMSLEKYAGDIGKCHYFPDWTIVEKACPENQLIALTRNEHMIRFVMPSSRGKGLFYMPRRNSDSENDYSKVMEFAKKHEGEYTDILAIQYVPKKFEYRLHMCSTDYGILLQRKTPRKEDDNKVSSWKIRNSDNGWRMIRDDKCLNEDLVQAVVEDYDFVMEELIYSSGHQHYSFAVDFGVDKNGKMYTAYEHNYNPAAGKGYVIDFYVKQYVDRLYYISGREEVDTWHRWI